eukprot:Colp12_sorted_trinity150504_noHs@33963
MGKVPMLALTVLLFGVCLAQTPTSTAPGSAWVDQQRTLIIRKPENTNENVMAAAAVSYYNLPYDELLVPAEGFDGELPLMRNGKPYYDAIVYTSLSYAGADGRWLEPLTSTQVEQIRAYEAQYGVRRVTFQVIPSGPVAPANTSLENIGSARRRIMYLSSYGKSMRGELSADAALNIRGLWHYPAKIVDPSMAQPVLLLEPDAPDYPNTDVIAAVIKYPDGREHLDFYMTVATWSSAANEIATMWVIWVVRGQIPVFFPLLTFLVAVAPPLAGLIVLIIVLRRKRLLEKAARDRLNMQREARLRAWY